MIRVSIAGITGWTGRALAAAVAAADDLELVSGVARATAGRPIREALGLDVEGLVYPSVADALSSTPTQVLVDYTSAEAVRGNAEAAIAGGVHLVIGASGLGAADYQALDRLARPRGVGVFAAGNFSVMAAVLVRAARLGAQHLRHWEVIDYAGDSKPDVPSGTARELAETMAQVGPPAPALEPPELIGPPEARGASVSGTRIHSLRLPGFLVTTEAVFGGRGERLLIRHDAGPTPEPYMVGTLLAIRRVGEVPGVRRGLDSLLFEP